MSQKLTRNIALYGVGVYLLALLVVSVVFHEHAMQTKWILWGIGEVLFFFVLTTVFYPRWKNDEPKKFWLKVFWVALAIRLLYVILSYYYFKHTVGFPFDAPGDGVGYFNRSVRLSRYIRRGDFGFVVNFLKGYSMGFSDHGYLIWLISLHTIFGRGVLVARVFKALMSAYLCIVVYKLTSRTFGERFHAYSDTIDGNAHQRDGADFPVHPCLRAHGLSRPKQKIHLLEHPVSHLVDRHVLRFQNRHWHVPDFRFFGVHYPFA